MSIRRLPTTIGETLTNLRRATGWPGLVVGILCLPIVLLALLVSFPLVGCARLTARWGWWPNCRRLQIGDRTLSFSWSGTGQTTRRALADSVALLIEAVAGLPDIGTVSTLEIRNPDTGFAIDPNPGVLTDDLAEGLTGLLWGAKVECGELVVNGSTSFAALDADARNPLSGHLYIEFPGHWHPEAIRVRAESLGFGLV